MSFVDFMLSKKGALIAPLLSSSATIARMEELSSQDVPAVAALDEALAGKLELSSTERQYVGRWVRDELAKRNWRVGRQKRLSGGKLFTSGTVYQRRGGGSDDIAPLPIDLLPTRERVARAQAMVRQLGGTAYSVEDFLRDKYADAAREDGAMPE